MQSNAAGKRCDECQAGTFGLQEEQAEGCVPCFCFNRTTQCREAVATWTQVRTPRPRTLSVNYDNTTGTENAFPVNTQEVCYINVSSKSTLSLCIAHVFGYRWNYSTFIFCSLFHSIILMHTYGLWYIDS